MAMDLKDIQNLIKFVAKAGVKEVELKYEDIEIKIKASGDSEVREVMTVPVQQQPIAAQPVQQAVPIEAAPAAVDSAPATGDDSKYITIKSPMIGTFYRRSSPDADVFVNVGDSVKNDTVVCVIEAMKLFNEIEAEVSGTIVKILVEDSTPVEYNQPLFLIDPA